MVVNYQDHMDYRDYHRHHFHYHRHDFYYFYYPLFYLQINLYRLQILVKYWGHHDYSKYLAHVILHFLYFLLHLHVIIYLHFLFLLVLIICSVNHISDITNNPLIHCVKYLLIFYLVQILKYDFHSFYLPNLKPFHNHMLDFF